eukprot:1139708-Pelagomonas_calceolata.AAC.1
MKSTRVKPVDHAIDFWGACNQDADTPQIHHQSSTTSRPHHPRRSYSYTTNGPISHDPHNCMGVGGACPCSNHAFP